MITARGDVSSLGWMRLLKSMVHPAQFCCWRTVAQTSMEHYRHHHHHHSHCYSRHYRCRHHDQLTHSSGSIMTDNQGPSIKLIWCFLRWRHWQTEIFLSEVKFSWRKWNTINKLTEQRCSIRAVCRRRVIEITQKRIRPNCFKAPQSHLVLPPKRRPVPSEMMMIMMMVWIGRPMLMSIQTLISSKCFQIQNEGNLAKVQLNDSL